MSIKNISKTLCVTHYARHIFNVNKKARKLEFLNNIEVDNVKVEVDTE